MSANRSATKSESGNVTIPRAWLGWLVAALVSGGGATAVNRWVVPPESGTPGQQYLELRFGELREELKLIQAQHTELRERLARIEENLKRRK